ncbi:MAG TPA: hypothetical protein VJZ00_05600 [Thermoanaerobaculia bacterium]|nr:hypothetical protein [Thermoanaerobaculia bacterium]
MSRLDLPQPVWFMLAEVEVTGNSVQPWIAGSTALVQAFVPTRRLEDALAQLDSFLPTQEMRRTDTLQAMRHHADEEWDELPEDYYREPLEQAARSNECRLGIFIVSRDSAWPHTQNE